MWQALVPIIGAYIGYKANTTAASTAGAATIQGAQIGADVIREGNDQAQRTLNEIRTEAAPATTYLRRVIASPGELTAQQQTGLEESRRGVSNQINTSNFAGSGRTAAALFKKSESDFINDALDTNSNRAYDAASRLQGGATSAATGIANSQANTGNAVGKLMADATAKAGGFDANAGLANGKLLGEAIGSIGSQIANEKRESRYADRMSTIEKKLGI